MDALKFYSKIYNPLFKHNYTKRSDRAGHAYTLINKHNIAVDNILDVGCAWGKSLEFWKQRNAKRIAGVDVAKIAVRYCCNLGFECYHASATDLHIFPDNAFQLYMATDVYEHLRPEDLQSSIDEAKRVSSRHIIIRPHPTLDKRGTLHLTVWPLDKWEKFFIDNGLNLIDKEANCFLFSCGEEQ